ncbi:MULTISPECIES: HD-GYP domain-containing protein [unclassified Paenibacillus]|uniref:HD-GYP domain-containing protein n=1 Tax=unclassified Paenibacillus TaxID=185978 RepID=UPI000953AC06|nr:MULTISPECIES: HD-GYP domain-containing protein [unclassified Paenibacillus]ASS66467.1 HD-GYP domain-containing protein [Paenibacillus sp. RUD330]SIQ03497.1 HDIG domain-containing protein [Paenibacillus sp. RU4X]SIQ23287.1 HDIG domain-containing protein [Paenibacillus sp. RU4T]
MRVHVSEIKEGDRLSSDAFNQFGLNVMSSGTMLRSYEISKLLQHGIDYVDLAEPPAAEAAGFGHRTIESGLSPKWLPAMKPLYESAISGCEDLFRQAAEDGKVTEEDVERTFQPLMSGFQMERDVVSMLLLLNTTDDYTYQHSVQVGMLSYYLSSWMGYEEQESLRIGKAGFLHDIGKCRIPKSILNKPGKLTPEEYKEIKRHTLYGEEIILNSYEDPYLSTAALQHHERMNGSGYPHGISNEDISPIAKIVAVADVYSAMISSRVYQEKRDLLYVLRELYRMSFHELDPMTTHTFIRHMIPNFIGKRVDLDSGQSGIIVMTHPTEFFRPLVQMEEEFIDLTLEREYEITQVYM